MNRFLSLLISLTLTINPLLATITIANSATSLRNANGTPVINIATPNSAGVSHNKYTNFNISQNGLILNNSKHLTETQLAGFVNANQNLKYSNNAKLILNEVIGRTPSNLSGTLEVAGKRADVIIANQNGLNINGLKYINTSSATLTTGKPTLKSGKLQGFEVNKGVINITGSGLDTSNISKTNLYAKAVNLNAKIYAHDLDIITGSNFISRQTKLTPRNQRSSAVSIDSSALGGIYANKIKLIGTDKGVGMRHTINVVSEA